jgi:predicted transcriptional regulator of viral defense system
MTGRRPRKIKLEVQGTPFHLKFVCDEKRFGTKPVWRGQTQIHVSDPSRTLIDMLDDPGIGGGIRQIADVLTTYFGESARNDTQLIDYARRLGNRTVFKRLGYLLETCRIDAPTLTEVSRKEMSAGLSLLDPTAQAGGRILKRWNLRVNVTVARTEEGA